MSPSLQAATKDGPKLVSDPGSDLMRVRAAAASSRAELQTNKDEISSLTPFHQDPMILTRNYEMLELSPKYLFTG